MMNNYTIYHLHSDLSNCTTNIDSVTKYTDYVARAKECDMKALGFSEHGNIYEWYFKKKAIEAAGMKYIHGVEAYITFTLEEKVRDSRHCVLIAKNYAGFRELNRLVSTSFHRKDDNHFYYVPRIFIGELEQTSNNILVTTACLGGPLHSECEADKARFLKFCFQNKDRVFLEIQHHPDMEQFNYNRELLALANQYSFRLIAGTDTHSLNPTHVKGRLKLQQGKGVHFDNEDTWDLCFKTYDELCEAYRKQGALPEDVWHDAINNTNVLADLVEEYEIDTSNKYPNVFENPSAEFRDVVMKSVYSHPYALKNHSESELLERVNEELETYEKVGATPYMLLKYNLSQWEKAHGIDIGYGRGSVNGSMIAYLLGITDVDSMRFDLNFFRFMNPSRVSLPDIDSDYGAEDRDTVKKYLLDDHMGYPNMQTAEIITFNTISTKGAIRDIARAYEMPLDEVKGICDTVDNDGNVPDDVRAKYQELFEYVDIVNGTIVSYGSHPCGILVSDRDIAEEIGLCSSSGSEYPITCLYMKELDALNYIKWDILGLDNVALINKTCKLAGIERITPDNIDLNDMNVWRSLRDDTTLCFQWESQAAQSYIRKFMSDETLNKARARDQHFSMIQWFAFGSGLLRPACASYRDKVANGDAYDNGFDELNKFLAKEAGYVCMQETIMKWLVRFCGYTDAESDTVRRAIAKKTGTETLLPEIERRFVDYSSTHYDISAERCSQIVKPFLQIILDASAYSFSWNHSSPYALIGYACGYLRYHYPLEFIATALNVFSEDMEKTTAIMEYAQNHNISVLPPRFGYSRASYNVDKERNSIYKGVASIKYMNAAVADALYDLSKAVEIDPLNFTSILKQIKSTGINSRQLEILISLDYFEQFGNSEELTVINNRFNYFKCGEMKTAKKEKLDSGMAELIARHATDKNAKGQELKSFTITDMDGLLAESEQQVRDMHLPGYTLQEKAKQQLETLGYIDLTTRREEDRRKLFITDMRKLKSKDTGAVWGITIFTRSVGSGKIGRLTVRKEVYDAKPFEVNDIVYASQVYKNRAGWWYLDEYDIVV